MGCTLHGHFVADVCVCVCACVRQPVLIPEPGIRTDMAKGLRAEDFRIFTLQSHTHKSTTCILIQLPSPELCLHPMFLVARCLCGLKFVLSTLGSLEFPLSANYINVNSAPAPTCTAPLGGTTQLVSAIVLPKRGLTALAPPSAPYQKLCQRSKPSTNKEIHNPEPHVLLFRRPLVRWVRGCEVRKFFWLSILTYVYHTTCTRIL